MFEPLFADDLVVLKIARHEIMRIGHAFRFESMGHGMHQKLRRLLEDGHHQILGERASFEDTTTRVLIDRQFMVKDEKGDARSVVMTPWKCANRSSPLGIPKKNVMRWIEQKIGPCFWVSIDSIRKNLPIPCSECSECSWVSCYPISPTTRQWTIARLLLEGCSIKDDCQPLMYPNLKISYPYLPDTVSTEKQRRATLLRELTLLPYFSLPLRRACHQHGLYDFSDPASLVRVLRSLHPPPLPGLHSYTIPWLSFMAATTTDDAPDPPPVATVNRPALLTSLLERFRTEPDRHRSLFIDFETLQDAIYLVGILVVDTQDGHPVRHFYSFWSSDAYDANAEQHLMGRVHDFMRPLLEDPDKEAQVFYYAAERRFWKRSCQRHQWALDDPRTRLFDHAMDVFCLFRDTGILLRDAPNQKLKTIGHSLYQKQLVDVAFPKTSGVQNGEDSMRLARELYGSRPLCPIPMVPPLEHQWSPGDDPSTDPWLGGHGSPKFALWVYNRYDCEILHQIWEWVLSL